MMPDYYKILGVSSNADLDAIKVAYRKKVMKCHPDRGGSHDQMVLVNTAWEVLSDTRTRRTYDEAIFNADNQMAQAAAAADAEKARSHAEQYPRDWSDLKTWLDRVLSDFTTGYNGGDNEFPAENSFSGFGFVAIGTVLGFLIAVIEVANFFINPNAHVGNILLIAGIAVCLGSAGGAALHKFTAYLILCLHNTAQGKLVMRLKLVDGFIYYLTAVAGVFTGMTLLIITGVSLYSFNIISAILILVDILFILLLSKGFFGAFRILLFSTPLFYCIFASATSRDYGALFFVCGFGLFAPILLLIYIKMHLLAKIDRRHLTISDWMRG